MQMRDLVKRLDTLSEAPMPTGTMPVALDLKSLDDLKRTNQNLYKQILQNNPQLAMADVGASVNQQQVPATGGTPANGNQQSTNTQQTSSNTAQQTGQQLPQASQPAQSNAPGQQPIGKNSSSQIPPSPTQKRPQEGFERFSADLSELTESLLEAGYDDTPSDGTKKDDTGATIPKGQLYRDASLGDYWKVTGGISPYVSGDGSRKRFSNWGKSDDSDAADSTDTQTLLRGLPKGIDDVRSAFFSNPLKGIPAAIDTRLRSKPPGEAEWGMDPYNLSQKNYGDVINAQNRVNQPGAGITPGGFYEPIATPLTNYLAGTAITKGTGAVGGAIKDYATDKFGDWRSNANMTKSELEALIVQGAEKRSKDWDKNPENRKRNGPVKPSAQDFYNQSKYEIARSLAGQKKSNAEKIKLAKERNVPEPKGVRDPIKLSPKDIGGRKRVEVTPAQIDALEKSANWDPKLKKMGPEPEPSWVKKSADWLGKTKVGKLFTPVKHLARAGVGTAAMTSAGALADPTDGEAGNDLLAARRARRDKILDAERNKPKESFDNFLNDMNQLTEELIQEDWKDDVKSVLKSTGDTLSNPETYKNAAIGALDTANTLSRNALTLGGALNQPYDSLEAGLNYAGKKLTGKPTTFSQEYRDANARTRDATNATNAFSRSALNSLTFGGYDQAEAGLEYALDKAQGKDPKWVDDKGEGKLDRAFARSNQDSKNYPRASLAGDASGNVIPFGVGYKLTGQAIKQGAKHLPKLANLASKAPKTSAVAGGITKIAGGLAGDEVANKTVGAIDPDNPYYVPESLERIIALTKGTTK